jgi:hypothetical protein
LSTAQPLRLLSPVATACGLGMIGRLRGALARPKHRIRHFVIDQTSSLKLNLS